MVRESGRTAKPRLQMPQHNARASCREGHRHSGIGSIRNRASLSKKSNTSAVSNRQVILRVLAEGRSLACGLTTVQLRFPGQASVRRNLESRPDTDHKVWMGPWPVPPSSWGGRDALHLDAPTYRAKTPEQPRRASQGSWSASPPALRTKADRTARPQGRTPLICGGGAGVLCEPGRKYPRPKSVALPGWPVTALKIPASESYNSRVSDFRSRTPLPCRRR